MVFTVNTAKKKQVAKEYYLQSKGFKVAVALCPVFLLAAWLSYALLPEAFLQVFPREREMADTTSLCLVVVFLLSALLSVWMGYKRVAADFRARDERLWLEDGYLRYTLKIAGDYKTVGANILEIDLRRARCRLNGPSIEVLSGTRSAYVVNWVDGLPFPSEQLGPMTKPFKLGLYFEPNLLDAIRPYVGHWES